MFLQLSGILTMFAYVLEQKDCIIQKWVWFLQIRGPPVASFIVLETEQTLA